MLEKVRVEVSAVPSLLGWGSETVALELVVVERRAGFGKVVVRYPGVRWGVSTYYFVRIWGR